MNKQDVKYLVNGAMSWIEDEFTERFEGKTVEDAGTDWTKVMTALKQKVEAELVQKK